MKTDPKSKKMRRDRYDELKMILEEHRLVIVGELQTKDPGPSPGVGGHIADRFNGL